jgi:hypothetical protein
MADELEQFVASLAIPAERQAIVLAELADHVACATEEAVRRGVDPEEAARAALGNLESLRRALEAIEPAFRVTRLEAVVRGAIASLLVAIVIDQGGQLMRGAVGALVVVAIAVGFAPPLGLLRRELRAPRIRGALGRGVPIGPALTYAVTVLSGPFLVWITMIFARRPSDLDVPLSAFAVAAAVLLVLLVESIRARRHAVA